MSLFLIYARAANGAIGKNGQLPWHLPADLKRFKALTMDKPMIMGRKTFESLPGLLPGRRHIVLTRQQDWQAEGAEIAHSPEAALAMAGEAFSVIGGAEIFDLLWEHGTRFELTEVHEDTEGEVTMRSPADDATWHEVAREHRAAADGDPPYDFVTYERLR